MSCGTNHCWTWAASPNTPIPVGTPCDCGSVKYHIPFECDCLQNHGHLYNPHSPKCNADHIKLLEQEIIRLKASQPPVLVEEVKEDKS